MNNDIVLIICSIGAFFLAVFCVYSVVNDRIESAIIGMIGFFFLIGLILHNGMKPECKESQIKVKVVILSSWYARKLFLAILVTFGYSYLLECINYSWHVGRIRKQVPIGL